MRVPPLPAIRLERARNRRGEVKASRIPARWLRRARIGRGDRVAIIVLLPRAGRLLPHSVEHAAAWAAAGYRTVLVLVVPSLDEGVDLSPIPFADAVLLRENKGYDFGAWAAAIMRLRRRLRRCATLALANDSVLGPSARFGEMLARVGRADADLIGLIASDELKRHFQSFVLFFKPGALRARAFARFWGGVRTGDRRYVIDHYETELLARFEGAGLRSEALFPIEVADGVNPTLTRWRALLHLGFPYLKVQLFRDNPFAMPLADWRDEAARAGFDIDGLEHQMTALELPLDAHEQGRPH